VKGKRHNTYIAPQAATAATVALYVTGYGGRAGLADMGQPHS